MKIRLALSGGLAVIVAAVSLMAATASAAPVRTDAITVPITAAQSGGTLNGVFTLTNFAVNSAGQLVANGTFTGTATSATGVVTNLVDAVVSSVVAPAQAAACRILDLTLGPLHLDLLGLVVDLNQVHLTITAVPGPGNLLGNLLCSVAHLLDSPGNPAAAIQNLLARLNDILAGL